MVEGRRVDAHLRRQKAGNAETHIPFLGKGSIGHLYRSVWRRMGDYAYVCSAQRWALIEQATLQMVAPGVAEAVDLYGD